MSNAAGTDTTGDAAAAAAAAADLAAAGAPAGAGTPSPADAAAAAAAAAAPAGAGDNDAPDEKPWSDPAKAEREILKLRKEAGDQRINAKKTAADEARTELLATLTKALDPNAAKDAPPATVETLTAKVADLGSAVNEGKRATELATVAWQQGLDPAKADYLQFKLARNADYAKLDPADAKFSTKLGALVTAEVTADPSLKLSGAALGSTVDQPGGTGKATMTKDQFDKLPYTEMLALYSTNKPEYDRLKAER